MKGRSHKFVEVLASSVLVCLPPPHLPHRTPCPVHLSPSSPPSLCSSAPPPASEGQEDLARQAEDLSSRRRPVEDSVSSSSPSRVSRSTHPCSTVRPPPCQRGASRQWPPELTSLPLLSTLGSPDAVDGGHRAIKYTRLNGVSDQVYSEGTHLMVSNGAENLGSDEADR